MIKIYHEPSVNIGDYLSIWLPQRMGLEIEVVGRDCPDKHYLLTGSIANHANRHSICIGAGLANKKDRMVSGKILAMRGLFSAREYKVPAGELSLLLPDVCNPVSLDSVDKFEVGIVPHFIEYYRAMATFRDHRDMIVIDVLKHPEHVIRQICKCRRIISSSLHGLIIAKAYGIPSLWVTFEEEIAGDGWKYLDYYGREEMQPFNCVDKPLGLEELVKAVDGLGYTPEYPIDEFREIIANEFKL